MNNNLNSDMLVDYLDNNLSQVQRLIVEDSLRDDVATQTELKGLLIAKEAIQFYGIKKQVNSIHKEMKDSNTNKFITKESPLFGKVIKFGLRIAASIVFLLLSFGVYQFATVSADKLFSENYKSYSLSVTRGVSDQIDLEKLFQEKKYAALINKFMLLKDAAQLENFLAGQAFMETQNYSQAIVCFNSVLMLNSNNKTSILQDDAMYYLALCYLKNKQNKLAYPIFETIHNSSTHLYNDKVTKTFMRQLKMLGWKS
jgi:tetratricopeptide (TPR) repeat protein